MLVRSAGFGRFRPGHEAANIFSAAPLPELDAHALHLYWFMMTLGDLVDIDDLVGDHPALRRMREMLIEARPALDWIERDLAAPGSTPPPFSD